MNYETFSEIFMAIEPEISKEQVIGGHVLNTGRWQCGSHTSHIAMSPLWLPLLTEKLSSARSNGKKKLS